MNRVSVLFTAAAMCGAPACRGAVTVSEETYHGWPRAVRMTNGTVELVVVPQVGRILRYGYVGGRNVLWENQALTGQTTDTSLPPGDWRNYGGDKLWPAPQSVWGWPPDPVSDSGAQSVTILPNRHLLLTGPESAKYGVRFRREIALAPTGTAVTIRNTMTNTSGRPARWGIWEVAQSDNPAATSFPEGAGKGDGYRAFSAQPPAPGQVTVANGIVTIVRRKDHAGKIGTRSRGGWIESRWQEMRFRIAGDFSSGGEYPDEGSSQEIYTSDDPNRYVEMELLAPVQPLAPGAETRFVSHWSLTRAAVKLREARRRRGPRLRAQ